MGKKDKDKEIAHGTVCTRYAPSPTGNLHVGGARTALFNYAFAKKYDGKFILRIEDTDENRNIEDGHLVIEHDLKLLNIFPDESFSIPGSKGPYLQSQKLVRYEELANKLVEEGKAYRCFCSEEELEESRELALKNNSTPHYSKKCRLLSPEEIEEKLKQNIPYTIRLKVDIKNEYSWEDLIRGKTVHNVNSLGDYVILRSNKRPTYNFSAVVDDHDMGINYVLRGEEHCNNTPYQLAAYHALGWDKSIPKFGHLSIIVDSNKKKLSKRSGCETHFVSGLIKKGYPPDAVFNFLALLGWSHGEEELFSPEEIIKHFDLEHISKAPAFFDIDKLNWISHKYFQDMTSSYYSNFIKPFFTVDLGRQNDKKSTFALANKDSISYAEELNNLALNFYEKREITPEQIDFLRPHKELLVLAKEYFPGAGDEWNQITIRNYLKQIKQISNLDGKNFYKPLRLAFSFQSEGFELVNVLECLGRETLLKHIEQVVSLLNE